MALGSLSWDLHGPRNPFKLSLGPPVPAWAVGVLFSVPVTGACFSWPGEWFFFFTLTLSLWSCSSITGLHLTLIILTAAELDIEFWAWPLPGLIAMSLSHDLGSQVASAVLPWPAQRCLQAKFQDHFCNWWFSWAPLMFYCSRSARSQLSVNHEI